MKEDFDIIAITTGNSDKLLNCLLTSIDRHKGTCKVGVILIKQGDTWDNKQYEDLILKNLHSAKRISLSSARNLGLEYLFKSNLEPKHVIFPDDDSTFDASFFSVYQKSTTPNRAYLGKIRGLENLEDYRNYPRQAMSGSIELLPYVASVSLIIPYPWLKKVGFFDPDLGAGAQYGSSEDLDYFLRATKLGDFYFLPNLYNLHPSRFGKYNKLSSQEIRKRFRTYTDGFLHVHFKHNIMKHLGLFAERALGGALLSLLKLKFKLAKEYFSLYRYRKKRMRQLRKQYTQKT